MVPQDRSPHASPTDRDPVVLRTPLIPQEGLDPDAIAVVRRLKAHGHQAYLVGGCVRDLLLRHRPKDFDIATSARPRQVKSLFRNCRIIGRRFKLAHLHFGPKILEVSTFRRAPEGRGEEGEDLLIKRDNEFGTAQEDALRRDFTINALFYDPEVHQVLDWTGGLEDLDRRRIRTINDPWVRFKEDPVRILRAVKFATRLGLEIERETWLAMEDVADHLTLSAPPRILEEIIRLLRSRNALAAFQMLRRVGALKAILPNHDRWLDQAPTPERELFWRHLEALDAVLSAHREEPTTAFVLGTLFLRRVESGSGDLVQSAEDVVNPFAEWSRISRRDRARIKRICATLSRFTDRRRRFKVRVFVTQDYFQEAFDLFHIRCLATGEHWDLYQQWRRRRAEALGEDLGEHETVPPAPAEPRREKAPGARTITRAETGPGPARGQARPRPAKTREEKGREEEAPASAQPPRGKGGRSAGERKGRRESRSGRAGRTRGAHIDSKETMCPSESRCVIPDYADRDMLPPEKPVPESRTGSTRPAR